MALTTTFRIAAVVAVASLSLAALPSFTFSEYRKRESSTYDAFDCTLEQSPIIKSIFNQADLPHNELGATAFALLYGYGFTAYSAGIKGPAGLALLGTNKLYNTGKLVTPGVSSIIRPNVDTIYGAVIIDLSQEDVNITIPPVQPNRYYAFSFFDPYGDDYANIGSRYASSPGNYLLRPSVGSGTAGLNDCAPYESCIDSPTYNGLLLIRVELKRNDTAELDYVNGFINSVELNGTNQRSLSASPLVPTDLANVSSFFPEGTLQLTARLGDRNPPQNQSLAKELPAVLKYAGLDKGVYTSPSDVNLTEAYALLNTTLLSFSSDPSNRDSYANGWSTFSSAYIGSYRNGSDIVARALVAEQGYGANTPDQSIYPFLPNLTYTLAVGQALLVTFISGKPPLLSSGFWSLTMYDSNGNLVPNVPGVYALGDRSNLTYSDGTLVYDNDSTAATQEPFQILVQTQDEQPPTNWTSNWLPGPASGASFQPTLRFYEAEEALLRGQYEYPTVQTIDAITA